MAVGKSGLLLVGLLGFLKGGASAASDGGPPKPPSKIPLEKRPVIGQKSHKFSEEESFSPDMPESEELKCDACVIVASHFASALLQAESIRGRPLKEFHIDDSFDHICEKIRAHATIVKVNKKYRYEIPGAYQVGESGVKTIDMNIWKERLEDSCKSVMRAIGEGALYQIYEGYVPEVGQNNTPSPKTTFPGAHIFVHDVCAAYDEDLARQRQTKEGAVIAGSCKKAPIMFNEDGWEELITHHEGEKHELKARFEDESKHDPEAKPWENEREEEL